MVGIAADPTGLDPEAVENNTSGFVMATIYDSLVRYKPGTVEVEPGLAERWDISADGLTYTFHLRPGVKFHDGTPLTADSIVQGVARLFDKSSPIYIYNTSRATPTSPTARASNIAPSATSPSSLPWPNHRRRS